MVIIRDLDEDNNLLQFSTCDECIAIWNYCYKIARHPDETVGYGLVELGMFGSCEVSLFTRVITMVKVIVNPFFLLFSQQIVRS